MAKTLGKNHRNIIAPFDVDFFMCNINIFEFRGAKKAKYILAKPNKNGLEKVSIIQKKVDLHHLRSSTAPKFLAYKYNITSNF